MPELPVNGAAGLFANHFDRLSSRIVGTIRSVFGAAPNDNESPAYYQPQGTGTGGRIVLAATIGVQGTGSFTVDAGSDFVCTRITSQEVDANGVILTTVASYLAAIQYTGNAKLITFQPVHGRSIFGDGFQSVPLAKNWLLKRSSVVSVTLTNEKAVAAEIYLTFHGWAVFSAGMINPAIRR